MKVQLRLFGAFRAYDSAALVELDLADGARVNDLRAALAQHGQDRWQGFNPGLLRCSAFADEQSVLHDSDPLPADGRVAVLPPVSGG
ncbi:MAG: MoaD/ThiS family protein [Xanthomonadaceae bacterium]|jgi:molybdopterin synthase sulfur carrier subunit|nr:MoaD/ThiS family protein [Xanthomonadaceae bacterium]